MNAGLQVPFTRPVDLTRSSPLRTLLGRLAMSTLGLYLGVKRLIRDLKPARQSSDASV